MPSLDDVVGFIRAEAQRCETDKGRRILIATAEALQREFDPDTFYCASCGTHLVGPHDADKWCPHGH